MEVKLLKVIERYQILMLAVHKAGALSPARLAGDRAPTLCVGHFNRYFQVAKVLLSLAFEPLSFSILL